MSFFSRSSRSELRAIRSQLELMNADKMSDSKGCGCGVLLSVLTIPIIIILIALAYDLFNAILDQLETQSAWIAAAIIIGSIFFFLIILIISLDVSPEFWFSFLRVFCVFRHLTFPILYRIYSIP